MHDCVGMRGTALAAALRRSVAKWEEVRRNELELQKVEQSIWETSGNETIVDTALLTEAPEPEAELESKPVGAEMAAVDVLRRFVIETFGEERWDPTGYEGGLQIECVDTSL